MVELIKYVAAIKPSSWCFQTEEFIKGKDFFDFYGGCGDFQYNLWIDSSDKNVAFLRDPMVVYRFNVPGSWTTVNRSNMNDGIYDRLVRFDKIYSGKYRKYVSCALDKMELFEMLGQKSMD